MTPACAQSCPTVVAIIPIKPLDRAKSRLHLPAKQRRRLALAFAGDTIAAISACAAVRSVTTVTADPRVAALARELGAEVVHDEARDLDQAVQAAVASVTRGHRDLGVMVAPGDLPALRAHDVCALLAQWGGHDAAFVPDRTGAGTTMVLAAPRAEVVTRYGPDSAARHRELGLRPLTGAPERVRLDVDTVADLERARALGLGNRTTAELARVTPLSAD